MSDNASTTRGWLTPAGNPPAYGEALERLLSRWIRGVSGLPEAMVRPRWQPEQPALPPPDTNWCAMGVVDIQSDDSPAWVSDGDARPALWRHEMLACLLSFYGPQGQTLTTVFRDGLCVGQNNDELGTAGLALAHYSAITPFPELINNQWLRRYDMTVHLRRKIVRHYAIRSLLAADDIHFPGE